MEHTSTSTAAGAQFVENAQNSKSSHTTNYIPSYVYAHINMPSNSFFLPLAPATSASYPQAPASRAVPAQAVPGETSVAAEPVRRRSSSSISSSSGSGHRILKLGPVHWGEHLDDHKEDFHEPTLV
ncbi:hypothetical protein C2857_002678 [Epichloe festucae Fl1]|uniref:Uncharacterized protein n=1 Tax=Epichloe festucae (strain Fl1) TaxID=877507 RepID=A0A7S9PTP7_EPIFF|nr:hypothetical protein C2857_002678 [Epichloe festucae Fl1]